MFFYTLSRLPNSGKHNNNRVRIYSEKFGIEDFVGPDLNTQITKAKQKVQVYLENKIKSHYIGVIH